MSIPKMTIGHSGLDVNGPYETFQDEKAPKTFNLRGFLDNLRLPEILIWYRGPEVFSMPDKAPNRSFVIFS